MTNKAALAKEGGEALSSFIEENKALIYSIVKRYIGRGVEKEDLFQLGCIGFIKAVRDYDESYNSAFSTYAVPKIAGEIKRFLRDDGLIKVSRNIKEKNAKINAASAAFEKTHGKSARLSDICGMTGLTPEDVVICQSAGEPVFSLEAETLTGLSLKDVLKNKDNEDERVQSIALKNAVGTLKEPFKKVIELRYYHALSQQKTADLLSFSQVQVSRYEKKALYMLKEMLS